MDAIISVLDAIYNFVVSLWDMLTKIVTWIAEVISLPVKAMGLIGKFSSFFPGYFWIALLGVLGIVVIFRFLKIYRSGG